ncbi:MAG: hypothetical protein ACEY3D_08295 [Rickettsia sp.]
MLLRFLAHILILNLSCERSLLCYLSHLFMIIKEYLKKTIKTDIKFTVNA